MSEDFFTRRNVVEWWDKPEFKVDFGVSQWTCNEPSYEDATKVLLSYGGGMGGSKVVIYIAENRKDLKPDTLVEVTEFPTMEKRTINTRFMVWAQDCVIAKVSCKIRHPDLSGLFSIYKAIPKELKGKIILK